MGSSETCSNQLSMVKNISTFYDVRELSYTLKWPWTLMLALLLVLVYIGQF